jgi:hypothetical protein
MWKATLPMKVKIFCWMYFRGRIQVTKELQKKGWLSELGCVYRGEQATADHLIFSCPVSSFMWWCVARMQRWSDRPNSFDDFLYKSFGNAVGNGSYIGWAIFGAIAWTIWNSRNNAVFNRKIVSSPLNILFKAISLLLQWKCMHATGEAGS